jgi:putative zinc finger/helix-turn-helix YgiT family protein
MKQIDCRYCGEGKMVEQTFSRKIKSGRAMLSVEGLLKWQCSTCASEMTDARQFECNADSIELAEKRSSGYVTVGMLREFREQYSLSQRDASKLIGAGDGAFGKYEAGARLSAPTAKLIRAALAIPDVVKMLAHEEGFELPIVKKSHSNYDFDSSIQEALKEAQGSWMSDTISIPGKLSELFSRSTCVNDSLMTEDVRWSNERSMKFMMVGA